MGHMLVIKYSCKKFLDKRNWHAIKKLGRIKNKNDKKDKKIFHRLAHTIGAAHHILRSLALSPGRSRINSSTFVFWFTNK